VLNWIIDFSLRNRVVVLLAAAACAAGGAVAVSELDIDAFPDVTPVQVQINSTPKRSSGRSLFPSSRCSAVCRG
jgi:heavy metal efflux system protein